MTDKPTAADRIKAAQEKRALIQAEHEAAREEQEATDLEALADLEAVHGYERIVTVKLRGWKANGGAATLVAIRIPERGEHVFKKFEQTVAKSKEGTTQRLTALHELAEHCVVYPDKKTQKELYDATMNIAPGVTSMVGAQVVDFVQGKAEEEKKD